MSEQESEQIQLPFSYDDVAEQIASGVALNKYNKWREFEVCYNITRKELFLQRQRKIWMRYKTPNKYIVPLFYWSEARTAKLSDSDFMILSEKLGTDLVLQQYVYDTQNCMLRPSFRDYLKAKMLWEERFKLYLVRYMESKNLMREWARLFKKYEQSDE